MKKIFLTIITVSIFVCSVNAQIKKGSIFLGGDISGSTQKTKSGDMTTNKQKGINISPVIGKAIKDNLVLGMNAGFSIYEMDNENNYDYNADFYNAGVFLRKYKNIGTSGFYIFVQGMLNGSYYKQEQKGPSSTNDEIKRITIGLNAYPGFSYAVSKKLHLETGFNNLISLNYFTEKRESTIPFTGIQKTKGFNVASSLNNATSSIYLGFRLLIGK